MFGIGVVGCGEVGLSVEVLSRVVRADDFLVRVPDSPLFLFLPCVDCVKWLHHSLIRWSASGDRESGSMSRMALAACKRRLAIMNNGGIEWRCFAPIHLWIIDEVEEDSPICHIRSRPSRTPILGAVHDGTWKTGCIQSVGLNVAEVRQA